MNPSALKSASRAEISGEDHANIYLSFSESDVYTLTYSLILDNGDGATCSYSVDKTLSIGVNADIVVPEVICVGEPFNVEAQVSVGIGADSQYQWNTDSELNFSDPNSLLSNITAQGNFSGNEIDSYEIGFTVMNDLGCWEEQIEYIDVYELVAGFSTSDSGEVCAPVIISFNSLYNNYVSSYEWSYTALNYLGEPLSYVSPEDTLLFGDFFNEMAVYDVSLSIQSEHGCSDTITRNSLLDIKRPYPYFTLETDYGCDGVVISVIDSSYYSTNIGLYTQNSFYDSTFYNFSDTTFISYSFPYSQTTEASYNYPITLNAFLGQCSGSYSDTVTVFANPVIDVSLSDSVGCPPLQIDFVDNSTYIQSDLATYYWDFGDGSEAYTKNPQHTYNEPGEYVVYHSVTSENGCLSDTLIETIIEVFEYPEASFSYINSEFCYGEANLVFENTSTYETDSVFTWWLYDSDTIPLSYLENFYVHFDSTDIYEVGLTITDLGGCSHDTSEFITIEILDEEVSEPTIDYVTVNDNGITIVWSEDQDENFSSLSIYNNSNLPIWNLIFTTENLLPNEYFHDFVSTNEVNNYTTVQQDSCGYYSDSSIVHSTILLNVASSDYQKVELTWTRYYGWDDVSSYDVYRSNDAIEYELIASVHTDSLSFIDENLCNIEYSYYVVANHPNNEFQSRSNKRLIEPLFVDFSMPIKLAYSTVIQNEFNTSDIILTKWEEFDHSDMNFYKVDRWDDYFGWIEEVAIMTDSVYADHDVGVNSREYYYRVSYFDDCGNIGPESLVGSNILLQGTQYTSHYYLHWNEYQEWDGGVESYVVQYLNNESQLWESLDMLPGTTLNYTDTDLAKDGIAHGIDTSYCYRVIANSYEDNSYYSTSNIRCFVPSPMIYFPNAFSPNDDGKNEKYMYFGEFAKTMRVGIFNRWGIKVFSSDEVDFQWDGTIEDTGGVCPQGTYILRCEMTGFDGTIIKEEQVIFLLR